MWSFTIDTAGVCVLHVVHQKIPSQDIKTLNIPSRYPIKISPQDISTRYHNKIAQQDIKTRVRTKNSIKYFQDIEQLLPPFCTAPPCARAASTSPECAYSTCDTSSAASAKVALHSGHCSNPPPLPPPPLPARCSCGPRTFEDGGGLGGRVSSSGNP